MFQSKEHLAIRRICPPEATRRSNSRSIADMSNLPPPPPPPPPGRGQSGRSPQGGPTPPNPGRRTPPPGLPRWSIAVLALVVVMALAATRFWPTSSSEKLKWSEFLTQVDNKQVKEVTINNGSRTVEGTFVSGKTFTSTADNQITDGDKARLEANNVAYAYKAPESNWWASLLTLLLPFALIIGFLIWMQKRASGQMGNVMSIGRSRAKAYSADKPSTTFADIAGYEGVKMEIKEVVDFLKMPERFREIGARVPKGLLLVGPPGTGKTLFARAVAGEAGVGFLSVTGSDFMEMFVGVGASRVRDLFAQARKMGRAIIFIDELDSIGRKRGAGLGGGHDEREQTLNQMLSEMDGFETSEGIVISGSDEPPGHLGCGTSAPRAFRPANRCPASRVRRALGNPHRPQP